MLRALRISLPATARVAPTSHSLHTSSVLRTLASSAPSTNGNALVARSLARSYASIASVPSSSTSESIPEVAPTQVEVNPNHGLYAFFRKRVEVTGEGETQESKITYESIEAPDTNFSGRSWSASELRRKSFTDLHTLWYVLLRERNLLATQEEEMRRVGIASTGSLPIATKKTAVRKSMARIKYVINERRRAYLGAEDIYAEAKEEYERRGRWTRARKLAAKQAGKAAYKGRQRELAKQQTLTAAQTDIEVAEKSAASEVEAKQDTQVGKKEEEVVQVETKPKSPTSARGRAADDILS